VGQFELMRAYHRVLQELGGFREELKKLEALQYPSDTCTVIISDLRHRVTRYERVVASIMRDKSYADKAAGHEDEVHCKEALEKLRTKVHAPLLGKDVEFLTWLWEAQSANVPWSFVPYVEKMGSHLSPNKKLLVYSGNYCNYGILRWKSTKKASRLSPPYDSHVLIIPKIHRANVLWHVLVAHELFHPRGDKFIDRHKTPVLSKITDVVRKAIPPTKKAENSDPATDAQAAKQEKFIGITAERIHRIWTKGMEELLSDMACVAVFGPAAVMAMRAFSGLMSEDTVPTPLNGYYPPWRYRLEVVWEYFLEPDKDKIEIMLAGLDTPGTNDIAMCFRNEIKEIGRLVQRKEGVKILMTDEEVRIAYDQIKGLLPEAARFVRESLKKVEHTWSQGNVIKQVSPLVER
jgi:hypothetical protein